MVKIVHDELARLMGGETAQVNLTGNPTVIPHVRSAGFR